jgi:hypothetical protein
MLGSSVRSPQPPALFLTFPSAIPTSASPGHGPFGPRSRGRAAPRFHTFLSCGPFCSCSFFFSLSLSFVSDRPVHSFGFSPTHCLGTAHCWDDMRVLVAGRSLVPFASNSPFLSSALYFG